MCFFATDVWHLLSGTHFGQRTVLKNSLATDFISLLKSYLLHSKEWWHAGHRNCRIIIILFPGSMASKVHESAFSFVGFSYVCICW